MTNINTEKIEHLDSFQITQLFENVYALKRKNDNNLQVKMEKYNFFRFLGLDHDECIFSLMMANMLKPKGSHGCGSSFLKYFIEELNLYGCPAAELNYERARIEIEKYIGKRDDKTKEGGRIDIFFSIPDKNNNQWAFVIENKIYAEDQNVQLCRYKNFVERAYPNRYFILYLTLYGCEPSENSVDLKYSQLEANNDLKYWHQISYKCTIKEWLEKCLESVVMTSRVHETVTQFLGQIKKLTRQDLGKMEETEFTALLSEEKNIEAAGLIAEYYEKLYQNKIKETKNAIRSVIDELFTENKEPIKDDEKHNKVTYCKMKLWRHLRLDILFGHSDFDFKMNITYRDNVKNNQELKYQISQDFKERFSTFFNGWNTESQYSIYRFVYSDFKDWINKQEEIKDALRLAIKACDEFEQEYTTIS